MFNRRHEALDGVTALTLEPETWTQISRDQVDVSARVEADACLSLRANIHVIQTFR